MLSFLKFIKFSSTCSWIRFRLFFWEQKSIICLAQLKFCVSQTEVLNHGRRGEEVHKMNSTVRPNRFFGHFFSPFHLQHPLGETEVGGMETHTFAQTTCVLWCFLQQLFSFYSQDNQQGGVYISTLPQLNATHHFDTALLPCECIEPHPGKFNRLWR